MRVRTVMAAAVLGLAPVGVWAQEGGAGAGGANAVASADQIAVYREIEREFREWIQSVPREEAMAQAGAKVNELFGEHHISVETMPAAGFDIVGPMLQFSPDLMGPAKERLASLAQRRDAPGAIAANMLLLLNFAESRQMPAPGQVERVLNHPGLLEALKQGRAVAVLEIVAQQDMPVIGVFKDRLLELGDAYRAEKPAPELAMSGVAYLSAMAQVMTGPAEKEPLAEMRQMIVSSMERSLATVDRDEQPDMADQLELMLAGVDGAHARGELLDHEAPDTRFLWKSTGSLPDRLSGLEGRVVVVDFWATWCMPCIMSFPKVRELVEHYEGSPVTVLGATHLQGVHFRSPEDRVDTTGRPGLEHELMAEFAEENDMTWPVVFTPEATWLEYGVQAIPHIVIIDPKGVVRYRELSPFMPKAEKIRMIDSLLKEFGLDVPGEG